MSLAISLLTMPTGITRTRRVARVYQNHAHPFALCLVAEKQPQLVEGPTCALPSLRTSNRCSLPNSLQVFERECLTFVFGLLNKPLADFVVDLALKTSLFTRQLAQTPAGAARVCSLQSLAMLEPFFPYLPDLCTAVLFAVRVGCQINDAKINANNTLRLIWRGIGFSLRNVQIPDICASDQFRAAHLPSLVVQRAPLEVAKHKLADHTTCQGVKGHPIHTEEAVRSGIVADAAVVSERRTISPLVLSSASHPFCSLISGAARELRAKPYSWRGPGRRRCDAACFCWSHPAATQPMRSR